MAKVTSPARNALENAASPSALPVCGKINAPAKPTTGVPRHISLSRAVPKGVRAVNPTTTIPD